MTKKSSNNTPNLSVNSTVLNNYFVEAGPNAVKNINSAINFDYYLKNKVPDSIFLNPVTEAEVLLCAASLPSKHSAGFDGLSVFLLQRIINSVAMPLTLIINKSLQHGIVPDLCKIARIVPIFKSGDATDYTNYRPISVLPAISKIFEKLALKRLSSFLDKHNILHNSQHGFRANHSTCTAALDVLNVVTQALDKRLLTLSLFIDISKAFDSINHHILLSKLDHYGVRGIANRWFQSYLLGRFQYTESVGSSSSLRSIVAGVPQGSILGPILFILYVNDLFFVNADAKVVMYADDTTISISRPNAANLMADAVTIFTQFSIWYRSNKLALNSKKTKYVIFCQSEVARGNDNNFIDNLTFDDFSISRVNSLCYLGVILDQNLSWRNHINAVRDKVARGAAMLKILHNFLPRGCLISIYNAYILPYLSYCIEVWGNACSSYLYPLLILQKKCIRIVCNAPYLEHCKPLAKNLNVLLLNDLYFVSVAVLMYKAFHDNVGNTGYFGLFTKTSLLYTRTRQANVNFYVSLVNTNVRKSSVFHVGVNIWNNLPLEVKLSKSVNVFRKCCKQNIIDIYV